MTRIKMRILITGATGFLGKNIVKSLQISSNFEIIVIGRSLEKLNSFFPEEEILKKSTDYSLESLLLLTHEVDVVIHLASQLMQRDTDQLKISQFADNLLTVEHLLIASNQNKVKQFVNTSSISVYQLGENLKENDFLSPSNIYGVSKANIESYLGYFQTKTSMNIVSLRLARLYGTGERIGLMFTDFLLKARRNESLVLFGKGSSTIEYIYIKDVVDVYMMILKDPLIRGVFNIGRGIPYSVKEIAENISSIYGNKIIYLEDKPDGVYGSVMDVSKAFKVLGWKAKWGLKESILDIKSKLENE